MDGDRRNGRHRDYGQRIDVERGRGRSVRGIGKRFDLAFATLLGSLGGDRLFLGATTGGLLRSGGLVHSARVTALAGSAKRGNDTSGRDGAKAEQGGHE